MDSVKWFLSDVITSEVGAIFSTALIAATIAIWGILAQRATTRRQVTADFIWKSESDRDLIDARNSFIKCYNDPSGMASFALIARENDAEAHHIRLILNEMELISIGIQQNIMDFDYYKRWHRNGVIDYYTKAQPFITTIRQRMENDLLYCELEKMNGWMRGELRPPRRWRKLARL